MADLANSTADAITMLDSSSDEYEAVETWDGKLRSSHIYRHSKTIFSSRKYDFPVHTKMMSFLSQFLHGAPSLYFVDGYESARSFANI